MREKKNDEDPLLRDIGARRWTIAPIKVAHMEKLLAIWLIVMRDGSSVLLPSIIKF